MFPSNCILLVIWFRFCISFSQCSDPGAYDRCYGSTGGTQEGDSIDFDMQTQTCYNPYVEIYDYQPKTPNPLGSPTITMSFQIDSGTKYNPLFSNIVSETDDTFVSCSGDACTWENALIISADLVNDISANLDAITTSEKLYINFESEDNWYEDHKVKCF